MPAERTVRHLKVRAVDDARARRAGVLLEDALRTASLPGEGAAVVLVRRLVLPPIHANATPQAVALVLEERCRALTILRVREDTSEDELAAATAVRFRDSLHAHLELCARLLRGEAPRAWCWPMAVSGFRAGIGLAWALRAAALSLAARQEAAAALPAWLDEVVARGGGVALFDVLSMGDADVLYRASAGARADDDAVAALWAMLRTRPDVAPDLEPPGPSGAAPVEVGADRWDALLYHVARRHTVDDPRWRWLAGAAVRRHPWISATASIGGPRLQAIAPSTEPPMQWPLKAAAPGVNATALDAVAPLNSEVILQADTARSKTATGTRPDSRTRMAGGADEGLRATPSASSVAQEGGATQEGAGTDSGAFREPRADAPSAGQAPSEFTAGEVERAPTRAAGLLFLLRVLEHIGFPAWLDADPARASAAWPARIFACVLVRLKVPEDDPGWLLANDAVHHAAYAGLNGRRDRVGNAAVHAGDCAIDADAVWRWLRECRRCLRRGAGIGMADLVLRPGLLSLTRTHVDVWLDPEQADIRIRRAGLDIDPGWVPWLERVVRFHYGVEPT